MMKATRLKIASCGLLVSLFLLTACKPSEREIHIKGELIAMDSIWDNGNDTETIAKLKPYRNRMDSVMNWVMGTSEMDMEAK